MSSVGIYKICSPSGKVYIGQSINIEKRFSHYKTLSNTIKKQRKLYASLSKDGCDKHTLEIIHDLPKDVDREVLNRYEVFYMQSYIDCGIELLNLREGGNNGRHSEETKSKISQSEKGKKVSDETKDKMSEISKGKSFFAGKVHSEKSKLKMSESQKKRDRTYDYSEERKLQMIDAAKKMREIKIKKNNPHWLLGKHHSKESNEKNRQSKLGCKGVRNKKVICSKTGIIYESIKEAAMSLGMNAGTLVAQLRGVNKNKTTFKYLI